MIPGLNIRGKASAASVADVNRAGGSGGEWKYTYTPVLIFNSWTGKIWVKDIMPT